LGGAGVGFFFVLDAGTDGTEGTEGTEGRVFVWIRLGHNNKKQDSETNKSKKANESNGEGGERKEKKRKVSQIKTVVAKKRVAIEKIKSS